MSVDIKKLSRKKKLSGKEIGQILILSVLSEEARIFFPQEKFNSLIALISSDKDIKDYNTYLNVYNKLLQVQAATEAYKQQASHAISNISNMLNDLKIYSLSRLALSKNPAIMTQTQYNDLLQKAADVLNGLTDTYAYLMFHCIEYFNGAFTENPPKMPKALKSAFQHLKDHIVTDEILLSTMCRRWGIGSYILPDGRKQKNMSEEEYNAEIERLMIEKNGGIDIVNDYYLFDICEGEIVFLHDEFSNMVMANKLGLDFECDIEAVSGSTQEDVLFGKYGIFDSINGDRADPIYSHLELFKAFERNFSELYYALVRYLGNRKALSFYLESPDPESLVKNTITWGELGRNRIMNYTYYTKHITNIDILQICEENELLFTQGAKNGIAIVYSAPPGSIDEKGYYKTSYPSNVREIDMSIDQIYHNPKQRGLIESSYQELLIPAIKEMYACNTLFETLADATGITDIRALMTDMTTYENKIIDINNMLKELENSTKSSYYIHNKEECLMLFSMFHYLKVDTMKPTHAATEAFKEKLRDLSIFNNPALFNREYETLLNSCENGG